MVVHILKLGAYITPVFQQGLKLKVNNLELLNIDFCCILINIIGKIKASYRAVNKRNPNKYAIFLIPSCKHVMGTH